MNLADEWDAIPGGKASPPAFSVAGAYGTPPKLLDNLRATESGKDPFAVNKETKAMGPYQFTPDTVSTLHRRGIKFNPFDEKEARAAADFYLAELTAKNGGDVKKGLAAYGGFVTKDPSAYVAKVTNGLTAPAPQAAPLADEWDSIGTKTPTASKPVIPPGLVDQIPGNKPQVQYTPPTLGQRIAGAGEAALTVGTSALAAPVAQAGGAYRAVTGGQYGTQEGVRMGEERARELMDALTYRPRSEAGREALQTAGKVLDATKLQGLGPNEMVMLSDVASGAKLASQVRKPLSDAGIASVPGAGPSGEAQIGVRPPRTIGESGEIVRNSGGVAPVTPYGSAGAAGASVSQQAQALAANASPGTQAAVRKAGNGINLDALKRVTDAESLPVPVELTKGQATQDLTLLSNEQNLRGKHPEFVRRFDAQNKALVENTNALREAAAPDIYVRSKPDVGDIIINSYRAKDDALNAGISAKYRALRDANGGQFPLDAPAFVNSADAALHKGLLYDFVPAEVRRTLDRVKTQGMTFENFESLRTNLARIQRSTTADGNAKAAAGVIRDALEEMPMPAGAEHLKPLADAARASAKARFDLIKADPAYKAVVEGKASSDKFINQFVLRADRKAVETMVGNVDDTARQAMRAGVIDQLKASAGIVDDVGNFSQAGYNKALDSVRPKLGIVFDPETSGHLERLGTVARITQAQPRGSFVNNSNTATTLLGDAAKSTIEGVVNRAFLGVPVGTGVRNFAQQQARSRLVKDALKPGAGILLKDIGK